MQIFKEIEPLKAFLSEKRIARKTIGLVPTMGALHQGHTALIKASIAENSVTVCSIYVNPSQFNNAEDLQKYPRSLDQDIELLAVAKCDAVFCPENGEMYGKNTTVSLDFGSLDKVMEGQFRPGHFSGVGIIVSKLFHIIEPHRAYFGQKDWQQFAIINQLVKELKFNVELRSVPTVRETDGLAMSSRNLRLTASQREKSKIINKALLEVRALLLKGTGVLEAKNYVKQLFEQDSELRLEYFEVADSENLELLNRVDGSSQPILCMAAFVGEVRLIDNMFL